MNKNLLLIATTSLIGSTAQAALSSYQAGITAETSLLGYYTFDEGTNGAGLAVDSSGNGYDLNQYQVDGVNGSYVTGAADGTSSGRYFLNSTDATSIYGAAGTANWNAANTGTPFDMLDKTGTVMLWFTHSGDTGANSPLAIRDSQGTRFSVHINENDTVGVWNGSAFSSLNTGAVDVNDGEWHHLGIAFEGANIRYVLDGTDLGTTANGLGTAIGGIDEMGIGGFAGSGGESWRGGIDEVSFMEDALTATEIKAHYDAMAVPEPSSFALLSLGSMALLIRRRL